jgi:hypothetical protein
VPEQSSLREIHIYQGTYSEILHTQELCSYIKKLLPGIPVSIHDEFIQHHALKVPDSVPAENNKNNGSANKGTDCRAPVW